MTIKNIVINGGGHIVFNAYGALKETHNRGLWKYDEVECFFGNQRQQIKKNY